MYTLPPRSTAMSDRSLNVAFTAGPPSPADPDAPVPAITVTVPAVAIYSGYAVVTVFRNIESPCGVRHRHARHQRQRNLQGINVMRRKWSHARGGYDPAVWQNYPHAIVQIVHKVHIAYAIRGDVD